MGAWRPKHVEKVCNNKICILLHHVGVLFNLAVPKLRLAVLEPLSLCQKLRLSALKLRICGTHGSQRIDVINIAKGLNWS